MPLPPCGMGNPLRGWVLVGALQSVQRWSAGGKRGTVVTYTRPPPEIRDDRTQTFPRRDDRSQRSRAHRSSRGLFVLEADAAALSRSRARHRRDVVAWYPRNRTYQRDRGDQSASGWSAEARAWSPDNPQRGSALGCGCPVSGNH